MKEKIERTLRYVEELFVKYGARPVPGEGEKFHLRGTYCLDGTYYRAEADEFEEGWAIVITATDNPEYARFGLEDNIAGFPVDTPREQIEKEIRCVFGMDAYPDSPGDVTE